MGLELLPGCDSLNGTADMRALFRVTADIQTLSSAPYVQRPTGQLPNYGCAGIDSEVCTSARFAQATVGRYKRLWGVIAEFPDTKVSFGNCVSTVEINRSA